MSRNQDESVRAQVLYGLTGFTGFREYGRALSQAHKTLIRRAFHRRSVADLDEARMHEGGRVMRKVLGPVDVVSFAIGMMVGAGIFATTGAVSATTAGPAVIISYAVAGVSAFLSAFCYAEFSADMPFAGGAYTYISASCGELLSWITVTNLILSYMLSAAGAIRNFSPYLAIMVDQQHGFFTTPWHGYMLDWWACGICLCFTVLLTLGTKESSAFNLWTTVLHMALLVFIIIAGFTQASLKNLTPFLLPDQGIRGVFNGASVVFFSYIGFDVVANTGEEVRNVRDLPIGILGAMTLVTTVYMLVPTVLVFMVPTVALQSNPTIAWAFSYVGQDWAHYVVALAACMGILTTTLISMYGVSRIITAVARDHLLPPYLARVHPKLQTPYVAIIAPGIPIAIIALFTEFTSIVDMVNICTLFVFWMVAFALLLRRGFVQGRTTKPQVIALSVHLAIIVAASLGLSIAYQLSDGWVGLLVTGIILLITALSYNVFVRVEYQPARFRIPLFPFLPIASIAVNTFLLGQMSAASYQRFGIWVAACTGVYALYGMHASALRDAKQRLLLRRDPYSKDAAMPLQQQEQQLPAEGELGKQTLEQLREQHGQLRQQQGRQQRQGREEQQEPRRGRQQQWQQWQQQQQQQQQKQQIPQQQQEQEEQIQQQQAMPDPPR